LENNSNPRELYLKYLDGQCTEQELDSLFRYFGTASEPELQELIRSELAKADTAPASATEQQMLEHVHARLTDRLFDSSHPERSNIIKLWPRIARVAASILLVVSVGGYFLFHKQKQQQIAKNQIHDIAPGSNKAILIAHGKQISITDAKNGLIVQQGNTAISKTADGKLVYDNKGDGQNTMVYDTLIIPRGGQHLLELADGSKIMLNADTKIRYPERFAANERRVEVISGEAIFHIKHNAKVPFYAMVKGQEVKDIGTVFDINAYDDEPVIKTTLVEGSVAVTKAGKSKLLKPGQQAVIGINTPITVQSANVDQVIAWEKGQFYFDKTNLKELMRQVSRWYNVDVVYNGNVTDDTYTGQPSRKENLTQMLKILELGDIHFKIEAGKGKSAGTLVITQ
jgi:hypothetical protein